MREWCVKQLTSPNMQKNGNEATGRHATEDCTKETRDCVFEMVK